MTAAHNLEVEQVLLGALLNDNASVYDVGFLTSDHFFDPLHGRLYETVRDLVLNGQPAQPFTLKSRLANDEGLQKVGGPSYLAKLSSQVFGKQDVKGYARIVKDLALRRQLATEAEFFLSAFQNNHELSADDLADQLQDHIHKVREGSKEGAGWKTLQDATEKAVEAMSRARRGDRGISTGLVDLDAILGGFLDGQLIVVAGRPSMGKTALALHFAKTPGTAFFSLEMPEWQLACRMMSEASYPKFTYQDAMQGKVEVDPVVSNPELFINDTPAITMSALRAEATRLKRLGKLRMVVVDYLQIMRASSRYQGQRVNEIGELTAGLKALARDLEVPVIVLSQLSRNVENREDKTPHMSDLRDSGAIEQDADVIMFVYREAYYLERNEPKNTGDWTKWKEKLNDVKHHCRIIVEKNRNGPTRSCEVFCSIAHAKFADLRND